MSRRRNIFFVQLERIKNYGKVRIKKIDADAFRAVLHSNDMLYAYKNVAYDNAAGK